MSLFTFRTLDYIDYLVYNASTLVTWIRDNINIYKQPDIEDRYTIIMKGNHKMFETYMDVSNTGCTNNTLWELE
jgi:hypothetical protein